MDLDLQPTLTGHLLALRPLHTGDFEALYAAASDPLVWEQHPEPLRYRRDVFQKFFDGAIRSRGAFVVTDLVSGRVIGSSRYYDYSAVRHEVTVGYTFLARAYWGGSYNREVKRLMLDHAFQHVERVLFEVGEKNVRSQKALRKIGARQVGRAELPGLDGAMQTNLVFAMSRPVGGPGLEHPRSRDVSPDSKLT